MGLFYDRLVRIPLVILIAVCAAVQGPTAPSTIFIDAAVTDDSGRPVTTLQPADLRVAVDGEPRPVVSLRYVFRGPGAEASAAVSDPARQAPAAAERSRTVLLAVDETSVVRGDEKNVVATVARLLDELGAGDQAAVVPLPLQPRRIQLTSDPAGRQAALPGIVGRREAATPATASFDAQAAPGAGPDRPDRTSAGRRGDPEEEPARLGEAERNPRPGERGGQPEDGRVELVPLLDGLRSLPGLKTLLVFRAASTDQGSPVQRDAVARAAEAGARARAVVHLVVVGPSARKGSPADEELRAIAAATGGTVTLAKNAGDSRSFDDLRAALWGSYLVEVERGPSDGDGKPHAVTIETSRSKTTVRAPRMWAHRNDPVPAVAVAPAPTTPGGSPSATAPAARRARRPKTPDAALAVLLARMTEYLAAYVRDFGNVVAEENYAQRMVRGGVGGPPSRQLRSDVLIVRTDGEIGWTQYRDVFEVDGKPVRDREARVQKLFLENPAGARRLAQEISNESARYNLGTISRTINLPTLPLALLSPRRISTLSFERDGEETVNGIKAARVAFEEMGRPTLVRPISSPGDAPASGVLSDSIRRTAGS